METEIPMAWQWYDEKWAIAIGGLVLAAGAATVYKAVAAGLEGLLMGRGRRIAALEATMSRTGQQVSECRSGEISIRQELRELRERVDLHDAELRKGELLMQKIELHMEAQSEATQRIEAMLTQVQTNLTNHLMSHK